MRDPSPYAGRTVRLRADAAELGGQTVEVVDWYERTGQGRPWREALQSGEPRAVGYSVRRGLGGLPDDDEVLFGRVDGMGQIVHVTELEGVAPAQPSAAPKQVSEQEIGSPCLGCGVALEEGDMVAALRIGPGANPEARAECQAGRPYEAVMADIHWACATGDESYSTTTEG